MYRVTKTSLSCDTCVFNLLAVEIKLIIPGHIKVTV